MTYRKMFTPSYTKIRIFEVNYVVYWQLQRCKVSGSSYTFAYTNENADLRKADISKRLSTNWR